MHHRVDVELADGADQVVLVSGLALDEGTPLHRLAVTTGEIVIGNRGEARAPQRLAGMTADEPGATGYENHTFFLAALPAHADHVCCFRPEDDDRLGRLVDD
jgi:hypothetical protein